MTHEVGRLVPGNHVAGLCLRCGCLLSGGEPSPSVHADLLRLGERGADYLDALAEELWQRYAANHSVRYMTRWQFEQALRDAASQRVAE